DNVGSSFFINGSGADATLKVLPGTDVLRLRGVIRNSIFVVSNPENVELNEALTVSKAPPWSAYHLSGLGFTQDVAQWQKAKDDGNSFSLILVSRLGGIAIAPASTVASIVGDDVNITFDSAQATASYKPLGSGGTAASWMAAPRPPVELVGI